MPERGHVGLRLGEGAVAQGGLLPGGKRPDSLTLPDLLAPTGSREPAPVPPRPSRASLLRHRD